MPIQESTKIETLKNQLSLAREKRRGKGQHQQSDAEIKLADKIAKLRDAR